MSSSTWNLLLHAHWTLSMAEKVIVFVIGLVIIIKADCISKYRLLLLSWSSSWISSLLSLSLATWTLLLHSHWTLDTFKSIEEMWQNMIKLSSAKYYPEMIDQISNHYLWIKNSWACWWYIQSGVPAHCLQLRLPPSVTTLLLNSKMDTPCEGGISYQPNQLQK